MRMMELQAKNKGLALESEIAANLPTNLVFDDRLVRQVLINLLQNAVKFTDEGSITLTVSEIETSDLTGEIADVEAFAEEQRVIRFAVRDTGAGIAPKDLERIFGVFEQADNQNETTKGVGLGLAISQRLLTLMQSRLQVKSRLGSGTTFWFDLPVSLPVTAPPNTPIAPRGYLPPTATDEIAEDAKTDLTPRSQPDRLCGYDGPRQTALIVDDNARNREVLAEMLNYIGFECVEAVNGHQGVVTAQETDPAVILMDLIMPEMNGLVAVRAMRAIPALSKTVIIAVSATVFESDMINSLEAGFTDFLPKPINVSRLHQTLVSHIDLAWQYLPDEEDAAPVHSEYRTKPTPPIETLLDGIVLIDVNRSRLDETIDNLKDIRLVEDLRHLRGLVLMGDISQLRGTLVTLREQYPENPFLWSEIENLLQGFQMGAIEALIEELIENLDNTLNKTTALMSKNSDLRTE